MALVGPTPRINYNAGQPTSTDSAVQFNSTKRMVMAVHTGLIVRSEDLEPYPVLSTATRNMFEDLVRILFELGDWHRQHGRGYGSIASGSLRSDGGGRCVVDMTRQGTSLCEKLRKTDLDSQRFVNPGRQPEPIDDLVSLGVAAAELTIAPGKRPAIEPTGTPYPKLLAQKLPTRPWHFGKKARRNRLIKSLLTASQHGYLSAADCLQANGAVVMLQQDGTVKPVAPLQLARCYPKTVAAVIAMTLLALLAGGQVLSESNRDEPHVANAHENVGEPISTLEQENDRLRSKVDQLTQQLASRIAPDRSPPAAEPPIETASIQLIRSDPLFVKFAGDPQFRNDKTASILAQAEVPIADFNYVVARLQHFEKASRIWWQWAADMASEKEIALELDKFEDQIGKVLKGWRSELARSKTYVVAVRDFKTPDTDEAFDVWIDEREETYLIDEQGKLSAADGGEFRVDWRYGQPLAVLVEERGTFIDVNVFQFQVQGALSIYTLAAETFGPSDKSYRIKFRVDNLPGPPVHTTRPAKVTRSATDQPVDPGQGDGGQAKETPIDPIDVIRSQI
jgi:hypothetical protein